MDGIGVNGSQCARPAQAPRRRGLGATLRLLALACAGFSAALLVWGAPAFAGQASTGDLLYYPCTTCHPVFDNQPTRKFPNDFKGHEIKLVGHDVLGAGEAACFACHDLPSKNPGMLKTVDGTFVEVTGDVSLVCYRCHSAKYKEFKAGTHGKHKPQCTSAGCHDPHTPRWIYAPAQAPFVGTGFQVQVLSEKHAFKALMGPPVAPATVVPPWYLAVVGVGVVIAGGLLGRLLVGRSKR